MAFARTAAWFRQTFRGYVKNITVLAAADPTAAAIVAAKTGHTFYVQKLAVTVTTSAVATLTFRDNAGTPVVIAVLGASAAVGLQTLVDSVEGIPLTAEKQLDLVASAAGVAGQIVIEGYWKQTRAVSLSEAASA